MDIKPKPPSSLNHWEALFASATRPQATVVSPWKSADDDGDTKPSNESACAVPSYIDAPSAGGYTILIQHSMTPKSHRQWALASTMAMTNEHSRSRGSTSLQSSMASMTLKSPTRRSFQESWYGMAGPFLARQAFEELCHRCDGAVVFVSVIGTSGVLDFDELDENYDDFFSAVNSDAEEYNEGRHDNLQVLRRRRNAVQLFRQNGACVDLSSDPYGWEDDMECDSTDTFIQKCAMNKLQSIVTAIRLAAAHIETRRTPPREQKQYETKQQLQKPIAIVFETIVPLLHLHGVEKFSLLLKSLGKMPSSATAPPGIHSILSPIIAPVLYESLCPSEHRCLEDLADAMVHLNLTDAQESVSVSESNDPNSTAVVSGVMDLVRRGGGGGGSLGGKLIRHCVPFHVRKLMSNNICPMDTHTCYWVLDHERNDDTEIFDKKQQISNQSSQSTKTKSAQQASNSTPSRPRIFLQDDDPEFDDFDEEEDIDDDLDF
ncbi:hypothetical protein ACHAXR_003865 [Thalassiosira sp. AJA248-18]